MSDDIVDTNEINKINDKLSRFMQRYENSTFVRDEYDIVKSTGKFVNVTINNISYVLRTVLKSNDKKRITMFDYIVNNMIESVAGMIQSNYDDTDFDDEFTDAKMLFDTMLPFEITFSPIINTHCIKCCIKSVLPQLTEKIYIQSESFNMQNDKFEVCVKNEHCVLAKYIIEDYPIRICDSIMDEINMMIDRMLRNTKLLH